MSQQPRQQPRPLSDPSAIAPFNHENVLQVVIETPRNSRNKYAFDHERGVIMIKKVLPAGMVFPYDFGFVPSTLADDGDPIDVLLLMDEPAFPGCVIDARLIGVIEGEDLSEEPDGSKPQRNDRLLAVASVSHLFADLNDAADLPRQLLENMQDFFATYPRVLSGKTYRLLGCKGPAVASALVDQARQHALETSAHDPAAK